LRRKLTDALLDRIVGIIGETERALHDPEYDPRIDN
jgi:hypothetical protein